MGFETPEEGYLARIMIAAGTKDVPIGKLVCIIVQDAADVAAFKDFKDTAPAGGKPAAAAAPAPAPAAAAPPPPPPVAAAPPPPPPAEPVGGKPMTAVEQRGPRVYASPMAKKLAEVQQLRLEGLVLNILLCFYNMFCFVLIPYLCMQVVAVVFTVQLNPPILQASLPPNPRPPLRVQLHHKVATSTYQLATFEVLLPSVFWNLNNKYLTTM